MKWIVTGGLFALAGIILTAWAAAGAQSTVTVTSLAPNAANVSGTWQGTITDPQGLAWEAAAHAQKPLQQSDVSPAAGISSAPLDATVRAEIVEALAQKLAS